MPPIIVVTLVLVTFLAVAAIRTRKKGHWIASVFFSIIAWIALGFLLFVLFV
jgi:uncharacterized membrane protein